MFFLEIKENAWHREEIRQWEDAVKEKDGRIRLLQQQLDQVFEHWRVLFVFIKKTEN